MSFDVTRTTTGGQQPRRKIPRQPGARSLPALAAIAIAALKALPGAVTSSTSPH